MVVGSKGGAGAAVSVQARSANKQKTPAAVAFASTTGNPSFLHRPAVADGHFWQRLSVRLRQKAVRRAYLNSTVQWCIAILIGGNFVSNVIEKEVDPRGDIYPQLWYLVEMTWNVLFIIELLWNMYGCFYVTRWKNHFFKCARAPTRPRRKSDVRCATSLRVFLRRACVSRYPHSRAHLAAPLGIYSTSRWWPCPYHR